MAWRAALVQMCSGDDPAANAARAADLVRQGARGGADLVLTPEVTNIMTPDRERLLACVRPEADDQTLAALRDVAREAHVWVLIGSLAIRGDSPDGRLSNRSYLIAPDGGIRARYDKIHMFDVELGADETHRESAGFAPGTRAVVADTPMGRLGLSICYDLRFAALHRALAQSGAQVITVPAAFTVPSGQAHWHVLLRARAIETGCFVLAPAQWGTHPGRTAGQPPRRTYGHALAVNPWGEIIAEAPDGEGVTFAQIDLQQVETARRRIPALTHDRRFEPPT